MKKKFIATAALLCAFSVNAQTNTELNEMGQKIYSECLDYSDKIGEIFNESIKKEYANDCSSTAFSMQDFVGVKKEILTTIGTKDFNPTILVSRNESDFASKLTLITSLLIESPAEKLELMNYLNNEGKNHSPEERTESMEQLGVKFK